MERYTTTTGVLNKLKGGKKKTDKNGGCNKEYAKNNNISHSFIFMNIKLPIKVYLYKI